MEYHNNLEATNGKFLEAIGNLNEAFLDERSDLVYYEYLANIAPTARERNIIYSIMQDERVNAILLRRMYQELSGIDITHEAKEKLVMPQSYLAGISEIINRESREIERYKRIRKGFPDGSSYIQTLSNIITRELNNITQLNTILSSNSTLNNSSLNENYLQQHTANFTLDDWDRFIRPLVSSILSEDGDSNSIRFFQKLILTGILIGLGNKPLEAIELVERWQQNENSDSYGVGKLMYEN
ncbi:ferritin-like domain-containing protein [Clostridium sp. BL-8]|uniref:ferritin-like domain-containing protein n=1 Tax=Clostridium sp. BL-8 TaxID=349938 RepID=UPI00098CBAF2|nr:ferritin-like domain-containing protein [Clostridium sp. BL-8]OOM77320.1 hypothetical protein CLOBL_29980 [Clostridium sp. BL-8]